MNAAIPAAGLINSGSSFYGVMDLTYNVSEPVISLTSSSFSDVSGNGVLNNLGFTDFNLWQNLNLLHVQQLGSQFFVQHKGFRYVRSAE